VIDVDRYHREVGRVFLGDHFINMEIIRDGFAWRYAQYDKPGEFTLIPTLRRRGNDGKPTGSDQTHLELSRRWLSGLQRERSPNRPSTTPATRFARST
jgi:nuclease-like protein